VGGGNVDEPPSLRGHAAGAENPSVSVVLLRFRDDVGGLGKRGLAGEAASPCRSGFFRLPAGTDPPIPLGVPLRCREIQDITDICCRRRALSSRPPSPTALPYPPRLLSGRGELPLGLHCVDGCECLGGDPGGDDAHGDEERGDMGARGDLGEKGTLALGSDKRGTTGGSDPERERDRALPIIAAKKFNAIAFGNT